MSKAKKQRIVYKEDAKAKAADLEEFLFGTRGDPTSIFEREKEECEETVAELVKQATRKGGLLHDSDLFFEDTRGGAASGSASSSSDDEDDDGGDEDDGDISEEEEGNKKGRRSGGRLTARANLGRALGGSGSEDEGGEAKEQEEDDDDDDDDEGDAERSADSRDEHEDEHEDEDEGGEQEVEEAEQEGPAAGREAARQPGTGSGGGGTIGRAARGGPRAPVWSDPDDTSVRVDVAGNSRLRKLRAHERQQSMNGPEYEAALRKQHQVLNPRTGWAKKRQAAEAGAGASAAGGDEDAAEAEALLASAGGLTDRPAGQRLPAGQIETTRLKDANGHQPSEAVVQAVRFHPNGQVLLTAGLDKKLRLFMVDGLRNPLLQAVHLADMPITDAAFAGVAGSGSGDDDAATAAAAADRVVLAGRRPHFYVYDMGAARVERVLGPAGCPLKSLERFAVSPTSASVSGSESLVAFTGDSGFIPLVSLRSRQWVANLKMSGNVRALAFSRDGAELLSTGDDGVVHIWDMRTRRCRLTFADAGNIADASSLALSPDGRFLATGAKSGVVNVYRRADIEAAAARGAGGGSLGRLTVSPSRELMNLTTDADTLVFSPDSQMLAMASRMKRDALRLVHLPSLTVFANWPTGRSPLNYVHSVDFSPHCGLLTIGNAKGRALLYRLHHYQQA